MTCRNFVNNSVKQSDSVVIVHSSKGQSLMTAYTDFVQDFPSRCLDLLDGLGGRARLQGREVTLLLMAASAGIVTPFERLHEDKKHPTLDFEEHSQASNELGELMKAKFLQSELVEVEGDWGIGKTPTIVGGVESWLGPEPIKRISAEKTCSGVFRIVRNALAHGNIFTQAGQSNQIVRILLVCGNYDEESKTTKSFSYLSVSPNEFSKFLRSWFRFLQSAKVSKRDLDNMFDDAA